jgi:hypothetical protein
VYFIVCCRKERMVCLCWKLYSSVLRISSNVGVCMFVYISLMSAVIIKYF